MNLISDKNSQELIEKKRKLQAKLNDLLNTNYTKDDINEITSEIRHIDDQLVKMVGKKEQERLDAIIVSSGPEVKYALKVAEDLRQYNFDIRVVVMPSWELFSIQTERYRNILLPKEIKTFTLEFSNTLLWQVFASGKEYALGLNTYPKEGTKAELLNEYNLDLDAIKTKIIEILKNN